MAQVSPSLHKAKAASRYQELAVSREVYLQRARTCSSLTLPYLIPRDDTPDGGELPSLFQSVGANGVTNLASKLLMTMLPPNEPCFRLRISNMMLAKEEEEIDKEFRTKIEKSLSTIEQAVLEDIEATSDRPVVTEGNLHLIVGGNALYYMDPEKGLRFFPLSRFVVERDPMGSLTEIVVEEKVSPDTLPPDFLDDINEALDRPTDKHPHEVTSKEGHQASLDRHPPHRDKELTLYTHIRRTPKNWEVYQECNGKVIPNTEGSYKLSACPWFAVRMYSVAGENYGRSYVEQQLGDLNALENLSQALTEASIIHARIIGLVNPNGFTSAEAVVNAANGSLIEGNASDVTFLQTQKGQDLQVVLTRVNALEQSLKTSFLMMDGVRRDAERVTAEEIRMIAEELEAGLGGVYTTISQEFQLPYITTRMEQMAQRKLIPSLPKELVAPSVVTGFDAIGRGQDKTKLIEFIQTGMEAFGQTFLSLINPQNAVTRLASAMGLQIEGLVKSAEDLAQEQQAAMEQQQQQQQQAQGMSMIEKMGPALMKNMSPEMMQGVAEQMQGMSPEMMQGMMQGTQQT